MYIALRGYAGRWTSSGFPPISTEPCQECKVLWVRDCEGTARLTGCITFANQERLQRTVRVECDLWPRRSLWRDAERELLQVGVYLTQGLCQGCVGFGPFRVPKKLKKLPGGLAEAPVSGLVNNWSPASRAKAGLIRQATH